MSFRTASELALEETEETLDVEARVHQHEPVEARVDETLGHFQAADAVGHSRQQPGRSERLGESLESMINSDPRTRDSIWMAVSHFFARSARSIALRSLGFRRNGRASHS